MIRLVTIIFCASIQAVFAQQPIIAIENKNTTIPLLSQEEISRMEFPAEGLMVLNKSTNCINYYLNNTWFQQCGSCLPETFPYSIDSITQKSNTLLIYFQKSQTDTLWFELPNSNLRIEAIQNPQTIRIPLNADSISITTYVSNKCYSKQREAKTSIRINRIVNTPPQKLKLEGKEIQVRNLGGLTWMCEDWTTNPNAKTASDRLVMLQANSCPAGWRLPSKKDWESLMNFYQISQAEIFEKPTAENVSIGLSKYGAYSIEEKRIIGEGDMGSYWVNDKAGNGNQFLINVTNNGYMFVNEKKEKAKLNLRCVQ